MRVGKEAFKVSFVTADMADCSALLRARRNLINCLFSEDMRERKVDDFGIFGTECLGGERTRAGALCTMVRRACLTPGCVNS